MDIGKIAAEVGVDRSTIFRRVGRRDHLIAEALWQTTETVAWPVCLAAHPPGEDHRAARVLRAYVQMLIEETWFRTFLHSDPARALRILTSAKFPVQRRMVTLVRELIESEPPGPADLSPEALAFVVVRVAESFIYAHGHADPRFDRLRDALAANLASGEELGAAVAVDHHGETLVDLWGGHADAARTRPWERDTIVNVWSTTKEISALAVLVLVERGLVDLDAPVATYWPEFAQNGKDGVLVRHVMSHTSGVSGWEQPFTVEDMYDRETSSALLAKQAPWWEPGTASGYHAQNQGHLIGEIVRRVSGRTLTQFVAEEIAGPLEVDLQIGASEKDDHRIAEIVPPPPLDMDLTQIDLDSPMVKTFTGPVADANAANTILWRRAEMGALNGHTNARALARTFSVISRAGTVDGVQLLSKETIDQIFREQSRGVDLVLGVPLRFGIGFALPEPATVPYVPDERACFWGGWGGSMTLMFPDRGLTISYVMNKMAPGIIGSDRSAAYVSEILAAMP